MRFIVIFFTHFTYVQTLKYHIRLTSKSNIIKHRQWVKCHEIISLLYDCLEDLRRVITWRRFSVARSHINYPAHHIMPSYWISKISQISWSCNNPPKGIEILSPCNVRRMWMWLNFNKCVSRNVKCWNNKHISPSKLLRFFSSLLLSLVGLMTNIFFRHSSKRCLALLKKKWIKKEGRKHPVVASVLLSIKLPVIFWDSPPHHWIYVLSLPYHVDLLFFFGWNMLQRLMILFRHILNYLCLYYGVAVWREREKEEEEKKEMCTRKSGTTF